MPQIVQPVGLRNPGQLLRAAPAVRQRLRRHRAHQRPGQVQRLPIEHAAQVRQDGHVPHARSGLGRLFHHLAADPDALVIDIGAKDKAEAEALVSPGDSVTFDSQFQRSHGKILSRAIDDRAGCALMIELIREGLEYDTTFAFVVQEEIGLKGGKTAAFAVDPDVAIVLESTTAADIKGVEPDKQVCRVGAGPVVSFMDRSTIYDKEYYRLAFDTAKELGIPCQTKTTVAGGNDAGAIHVSRGGVRCAAVSLPCRYLHSAVSMIAAQDYENALRLVRALARKMAGDEA